jgi:hypothetical protein
VDAKTCIKKEEPRRLETEGSQRRELISCGLLYTLAAVGFKYMGYWYWEKVERFAL